MLRTGLLAMAALLMVSSSGCFGGCYVDSHRLAWHDAEVAATLRALEGQANVTTRPAGTGLPIAASLLPVGDGNASLRGVTYSWPAETPEMDVSWLTLRATREGGVQLGGIVDAHLGRGRLGERLDVLLAGILADPADAPGIRQEALASYDPGRNDFSDDVRAAVAAPLRLGDLLPGEEVPWEARTVGQWNKADGDWDFEAGLAVWTLSGPEGPLHADAAGFVHGPELDGPGSIEDEEPPVRAELDAVTAAALARIGLGPPPPSAQVVPAGRICVD